MHRSVAAVSALAFIPCLAFAADTRPKCAVLGVRAEAGITQGTANLLSEIISSDVMHTNQYDVLTSADVATMIGIERQRQLLGCNQNDNCFAEIGAALGTDLILDASVGTVGTLRVLAVRLYDTKKSRAVARESITVPDESALVDAVHLAVSRVVGVHVPGDQPAAVAVTAPPSGGSPPTATTSQRGFNPGWIGIIAGGAVAIAGGIFGILALSDFGQYKMTFDPGTGSSAKTFSQVADGLYIGAAVVGIAAIIVLLVTK